MTRSLMDDPVDDLLLTTNSVLSISTANYSEPLFRSVRRPLTDDQLRFIYFASPVLTTLGYGSNIFVSLGLARTSSIKKPTSTLMHAQMLINLISITCQGIAAPLLIRLGRLDLANDLASRLVASASLFANYASLTMLLWITVNRHIYIWHPLRAERVFTYRLALTACFSCTIVGVIVASSTLFDCCYASFSSISLTFTFIGRRSFGQYVFAWIYMGCVLGTCIGTYGLLIWKIRKTKRALTRHHAAQRRVLFGMETRLSVGFGIVAVAWFVHLFTLIIPVVAFRYQHPKMSVFYGCSRWAMFMVDPFVYLLLTQDLRWATRKCVVEFLEAIACCWRRTADGGGCLRRQSAITDHRYVAGSRTTKKKISIAPEAVRMLPPSEERIACLKHSSSEISVSL